jgi:hypothetical protein
MLYGRILRPWLLDKADDNKNIKVITAQLLTVSIFRIFVKYSL